MGIRDGNLPHLLVDNRLGPSSFQKVRTLIKENLIKSIQHLIFPNCRAIAGVAYCGIPQGDFLANDLGPSFIYVDPNPKVMGMENMIEGKVNGQGQKKVVVRRRIWYLNSGVHWRLTQDLKDAGFEVLGMVGNLLYGFDIAAKNFGRSGP